MRQTLLLLFCIMQSFNVHAEDIYFKHLGIQDGLSQICIHALYQDEMGAIWIGSSEGLNRYNGESIKVYQPSKDNQGLPHNEIYQLCGDQNGHLYILSGDGLSVLNINKEKFTLIPLPSEEIKAIYCQSDTLWILTPQKIFYYTPKENKVHLFTTFSSEKGQGRNIFIDNNYLWIATNKHILLIDKKKISQTKTICDIKNIQCISKDSFGNMWAGTWNGLYRISMDGSMQLFTYQPNGEGLSDNQVRSVIEDDYGYLWIGTFRGLDCYDPVNNSWRHYINQNDFANSLSHNSVTSFCKDRQGNIWVGTYYGGVNVFTPNRKEAHFYPASQQQSDKLSFPFVGRMVEDDLGKLWVCTEGGGLNSFDPKTGKFSRYLHTEGNNNSIGNNNLKAICFNQPMQKLYIATHMGGLSIFDIHRNSFHTLGQKDGLPHQIVNNIQEYKDGLAVLTLGGMVFMDLKNETFSPLSDDPRVQKELMRSSAYETFFIDSQNRLWLAQSEGGVICINLSSSKIEKYKATTQKTHSIGKFKVVTIFEDSRGEVYFGTAGSGIYKFQNQSNSFKAFNTENHVLPSDYCYFISESPEKHKILLLHNKGLSLFNPNTEKVEQTYRFFQQNYSQGSSLYVSKDKTLYIGGINGLVSCLEQYLYTPTDYGKLHFDKLQIFNNEVVPGDKTGILNEIISCTSGITLQHDQNNLTLNFGTFNYHHDRNERFQYILENLDKHWIETSKRSITYTNLPPGNYTLRVRLIGTEQKAVQEIALNICIKAPFYATPYAYGMYMLLLLGLLYLFFHFKLRQARLHSSLEYERKEKERIEELNQSKLRFFTNISHEFRTPLTLIMGQIEILLQMNQLDPSVYNRILRIYKNSWHMRNLISELLDFRKQEQGYLKLRVEEHDLISFTHEIFMCFYEYSQKKHINYRFEHLEDKVKVWFDTAQLQKVIFNLLSNAFKYTPDGGSIVVTIRCTSTQVYVSIADTGIGIPQESIHKIFDRFYQTDTNSPNITLGTGIGLALSKGIIDAHHGEIKVESVPEKGSSFTLALLLGNNHFSKEEVSTAPSQDSSIHPEILPAEVLKVPDSNLGEIDQLAENRSEDGSNPVILIVEDNHELLELLVDTFRPMYEVHTAVNGREGLEAVKLLQPDLVLSDVMMPEMSGKEMCYKLKNNVEFSHIPIILLTAQTSVEYLIEGYMFGADDYITKPFNIKVLIARCNNLLRNKRKLIAHYSQMPAAEIADTIPAASQNDKEFLEKSIRIVKDNFDNPDFDVTILASELCMGRSKLYLQFKEITGLTPNEFILKVKLEEAMNLLKNNPELNVSEISFRIGFSSPRYFSKCFKSFFGIVPQNIRKTGNEKPE